MSKITFKKDKPLVDWSPSLNVWYVCIDGKRTYLGIYKHPGYPVNSRYYVFSRAKNAIQNNFYSGRIYKTIEEAKQFVVEYLNAQDNLQEIYL